MAEAASAPVLESQISLVVVDVTANVTHEFGSYDLRWNGVWLFLGFLLGSYKQRMTTSITIDRSYFACIDYLFSWIWSRILLTVAAMGSASQLAIYSCSKTILTLVEC